MNPSPPHPTKTTVFAYFAQQATPLERQLIENWLASEEGTALYYTYLDEWERQHPQFYPDVEKARTQFTRFMGQPPTEPTVDRNELNQRDEPVTLPIQRPALRWFWAVAASVLVIMGLWLTSEQWRYTTLTNPYGRLQSLRLPDGSTVVLGANSALRYARFVFDSGNRQVFLTGEAQFRVTHQPNDRRFIVTTPDRTTVEVFGTVFTVNSRRNQTRVVLETGRVRLITPQMAQPVLLAPGDVVVVSAKGQPQKQHVSHASARVTWHDHEFVFADTPLTDVATQLHDTFGVTVQIPQPELMTRTVSGTFQAETADDLLQALKLMMNLHVRQGQSQYVLTQ